MGRKKKIDVPLVQSEVVFYDITHTYENKRGESLMGVTSLMRKHGLSPDYSNISPEVLQAAADRGTKIHEDIEAYDNNIGVEETPEVKAYSALKLNVLCSEYLVSDNVLVASKIDKVLADYSIADIKTTSELHTKSLEWQLSIYAYLFEKQNPLLKVPALYAIHIRNGKAKKIEVNRIPDMEIESLLECEDMGVIYSAPAVERINLSLIFSKDELVQIEDVENRIIEFEENKKMLEATREQFRSKIYDYMVENNCTEIEGARMKYTLVRPTTRQSIDTTLLKKEMPEIAEKYTKVSNVKGSVRFKFKDTNN